MTWYYTILYYTIPCNTISSVQPLSQVRLCDPMNCSTPDFPMHHQLPELSQTHVHWVSDAGPLSRWCHPTVSSSVNLFFCFQSFSVSRSFPVSQFFTTGGQKYWSFSFSISSSNEYSGLTSFGISWLDLLAVKGTHTSLLQHHSSKASIL